MSKAKQRALALQQEAHRMWSMGIKGTPISPKTTATKRCWGLYELGLRHAARADESWLKRLARFKLWGTK